MKPQTKIGINSNVRDYLNREFNAFNVQEEIDPDYDGGDDGEAWSRGFADNH